MFCMMLHLGWNTILAELNLKVFFGTIWCQMLPVGPAIRGGVHIDRTLADRQAIPLDRSLPRFQLLRNPISIVQ
jgi:hypothetical protein